MREYAGVSGGTKNGFADFASIAFHFPSMCIRAFDAEKPRTLYSRSALLASRLRRTAGFNFFQVLSEPFANLRILAFGQLLLEFV